jgi:hypothetical protein
VTRETEAPADGDTNRQIPAYTLKAYSLKYLEEEFSEVHILNPGWPRSNAHRRTGQSSASCGYYLAFPNFLIIASG